MSRIACDNCGKISRVSDLGLCPDCQDEELAESYGTIGAYEGYLPTNDLED